MRKRRNRKNRNESPRKCPKCGSRLEPDFHFCPFCGLQLKNGVKDTGGEDNRVYGENTASQGYVERTPDEFGDAFDLLKEIQAAPADEIDPEPDYQESPPVNIEKALGQMDELEL